MTIADKKVANIAWNRPPLKLDSYKYDALSTTRCSPCVPTPICCTLARTMVVEQLTRWICAAQMWTGSARA
eukprot:1262736-Amphidinium_carterae.1